MKLIKFLAPFLLLAACYQGIEQGLMIDALDLNYEAQQALFWLIGFLAVIFCLNRVSQLLKGLFAGDL